MGIKTNDFIPSCLFRSLKNLPTTWGLRLCYLGRIPRGFSSEKPPHHMGIKTIFHLISVHVCPSSEKPPHHMGIKT